MLQVDLSEVTRSSTPKGLLSHRLQRAGPVEKSKLKGPRRLQDHFLIKSSEVRGGASNKNDCCDSCQPPLKDSACSSRAKLNDGDDQ